MVLVTVAVITGRKVVPVSAVSHKVSPIRVPVTRREMSGDVVVVPEEEREDEIVGDSSGRSILFLVGRMQIAEYSTSGFSHPIRRRYKNTYLYS